MPWYDLPKKDKLLVMMMIQRAQKDFLLTAGNFPSQIASQQLITQLAKQIYSILNLLLKT